MAADKEYHSGNGDQGPEEVVQQFFASMMTLNVDEMKSRVSFPFCSVFVSPENAYPLQIDTTEAEFEKRFSAFEQSFDGKSELELEQAKKLFARTVFSNAQIMMQGDSAYVTCVCEIGGGARLQKLMSMLQRTSSRWKIVFTTLPT